MAVILGNDSKIEGGSGAFRIRNSSGTNIFEQGVTTYSGTPFGYYTNNNIPAFVAGRTPDPGAWTTLSDGAWRKANAELTVATLNRGSCYDTSTTRFTAPISGPYLFIYSSYTYAGNYYHPIFGVNGSTTLRHGLEVKYRLRGHGYVSNYQTDGQIEEVIWLAAGDYVEVFFAPSGTAYYYPYYTFFSGVYVG